jgi:hypothetical protein
MRLSPVRIAIIAGAALVALAWAGASSMYVIDSWEMRKVNLRRDIFREQAECKTRPGPEATAERCRDLAELMTRARYGERYIFDFALVFGPTLGIGILGWYLQRRFKPRPAKLTAHAQHLTAEHL